MTKVCTSVFISEIFFLFIFVSANGETLTCETLHTVERIQANGYPAEKHNIVTEDGYILELDRILPGNRKSPIVFLMHGFLSSSDRFIGLGPQYGVAYNYADAGFDVWMGNARGSRKSRNHTNLNPDDKEQRYEFFDFSFEEIGIHDVAASVDYILDVADQDKLHYIGHSQGGTVFLILNSLKQEYNDKFKSAHLLAGVGYQDHFPNEALANVAKVTNLIYGLANRLGVVEIFPPHNCNLYEKIENVPELCVDDVELIFFCDQLMFGEILSDNNYGNSPIGGASMKQLAHYGQNIRDKAFRCWNYGVLGNLLKYGQSHPPAYDLRLISVNVTMHYTVSDTIVDELDVIAMAKDMPNARVREVPKQIFKHSDFVESEEAKELVTDYIIRAILDLEAK